MITVKRIFASELLAFVSHPAYSSWDVVPISIHRAKSYVANPRCSANDVVLYLAFKNNTLVGYRTVLPDYIYSNNEEVKVGWLSGSWVDPKFRRQGISTSLLNEAFADWNGNLIFTNYAPEAKAVFDKSQMFTSANNLIGVRVYIKSCLSELLVNRGKVFKLMFPLLKAIDFLLNLVNVVPLFLKSINLKEVEFENLKSPDDEVLSLFEKVNLESITRRGTRELNWIIDYPWLISAPLGDKIGQKYFFSSSPKRFEQNVLKVYKNNLLIGFIMLNIRDGVISAPYIYCENGNERLFAKVLLKHAAIVGASRVTVFNELIAKELKLIFPLGFFSKTQNRNYYLTSSLHNKLKIKPLFVEGDGDCAFV
jgi:GNAT superfamily N-acetyltransferase